MSQLILFDGVCNLCNSTVDSIIKRDKAGRFRFASLQSEAGKNIFLARGIEPEAIRSLVYMENSVVYYKSTAILRILKQLGGIYMLFYLFILVPPFIRDFIYDKIATNRYRWFGRKETCRIPSESEKERFITSSEIASV